MCGRCFHSIAHKKQNHTPHHSNRQHFIVPEKSTKRDFTQKKRKQEKNQKKRTRVMQCAGSRRGDKKKK